MEKVFSTLTQIATETAQFANEKINNISTNTNITGITTNQPRGLHNFIQDIRNTHSKDEERMRIDKELANIRAKFANSSNLSSYQKKKYVWKMCYIHVLGYEIDFGHLEFISLLSSTKFSEKAVGYMAVSLFMRPGDQLLTLVVNSIRNDLKSYSNYNQTVALAAVSNINGAELTEALAGEIEALVIPSESSGISYHAPISIEEEIRNKSMLSKKGALALLSFYRVNPDCILLEEWIPKFVKLLDNRDVGVVTSGMSLLIGVAENSGNTFQGLIPNVLSVLGRLARDRSCPTDYMYYRIASPWLQVKCLRFLQLFGVPTNPNDENVLCEILSAILNHTDISENPNKANTEHCILIEAINLILKYGLDARKALRDIALSSLGRFIGVKDPNIRYLGLDALGRLARLEGATAVQEYQDKVIESLNDIDISVRKRALNLIFVMTNEYNSHHVVEQLVTNLAIAETIMKEEYVVKIAILAEKFNDDWSWYVDVLTRVVLLAGEDVAEAVWFRIVQVVINHSDIHTHAANRMFDIISDKYANETAIALSGYLLGEIGENICQEPRKSGYDQFIRLNEHYNRVSIKTQAILLTTFVKLYNLYPELNEMITNVFTKYSTSTILEIQQRACEYLALPHVNGDRSIMENTLNTMPTFPEDRTVDALYVLLEKDKQKNKSEKDEEVDETSTSDVDLMGYTNNNNNNNNKPNLSIPVAKPVEVNDLLSLDDDDDVPVVSVSVAPSHSHGHSLLDDSDDSFTNSISTSSSSKQLDLWYKEAISAAKNQKCVYFEDELLRVMIACDYRLHQGRIALLITNKTGTQLINLKVSSSSSNAINIRVQDPNTTTLSPNEDAKLFIAVDCMRPFDIIPIMSICFNIGQAPYNYDMKLPLAATSFMEAVAIQDKDIYLQQWKVMIGEGLENQEVFTSSKPLTSDYLDHIRNILFPNLHIGLMPSLDTNQSITGVTSFRTGTPGNDGNLLSVGALLRIEADLSQNKFRVIVRAKNPIVSKSLKDALKVTLSL